MLKLPARTYAKSHRQHFFYFSTLCVFKFFLKELVSKQAKSHWLHLFDFSTLCVFKCFLKELLDLKRQSHIGCIFSTVRFHMFPQIACPNRCKVTMVAFFLLFSTVHYQMFPQRAWILTGKVTLVAFVWFFPLCVFWCVLKLPARTSHIGSIFLIFLQCVFKGLFEFLNCAFSDVTSNCLPEQIESCIGCICLTFLHCALSNVSSKSLDLKRQSHICFDFSLLSVIKCFLKELGSKQALNCLPEQMQSHIGCILLTFLHCAFKCLSDPGLLVRSMCLVCE